MILQPPLFTGSFQLMEIELVEVASLVGLANVLGFMQAYTKVMSEGRLAAGLKL